MAQVLLSLGSNIEPRKRYLSEAVSRLSELIEIKRVSGLYQSASVGFEGDDFLNAALLAETDYTPIELLEIIHRIEQQGGRVRSEQIESYVSRTIDIDIVFYDRHILLTPVLIIPHPRFAERNFVLKPLAEIYPDFIDPVSQLSLSELISKSSPSTDCILHAE